MEMMASDSLSGKAWFAANDRRPGTKNLNKLVDPLSDAKEEFNFWAGRSRFAMDRLHK